MTHSLAPAHPPDQPPTSAVRGGASLGYRPTIALGDGSDGHPRRAPYDRIIATCAVSAIPAAWIDQLASGGRIITDLRTEMSSSLAVLDKISVDTVSGRLLDQPGHFMWLRPDPDNPLRDANRFNFVIDLDSADSTTAGFAPRVLDEPGFRVLLGILEPSLSTPSRGQREGVATWWMHAEGGSWVEIVGNSVTQGGPRRLWPSVEQAATDWQRLGRPGRGRYGLTATTTEQHIWLDNPDGEHHWPLRSNR